MRCKLEGRIAYKGVLEHRREASRASHALGLFLCMLYSLINWTIFLVEGGGKLSRSLLSCTALSFARRDSTGSPAKSRC
jgi:hypothetical protein